MGMVGTTAAMARYPPNSTAGFMDWDKTHWNPFYFGRYQDDLIITQIALPVLLCLLVFLLVALRRGKRTGYLMCVCLFVCYLFFFVGATVFPFPTHFNPGGFPYGSLHLIPALIEGTDPEFRLGNIQVWGNFLAGFPFGVALPFVADARKSTLGRVAGWGLAFAIAPELVQLLQNWLFDEFCGRAIDIDDIWLCFAGTLAGYGILRLIAHLYHRLGFSRGSRFPLWNHFHNVLTSLATKPDRQAETTPLPP